MHPPGSRQNGSTPDSSKASTSTDIRDQRASASGRKKEKNRGQNTNRQFGTSRDEKTLCQSRATYPEFSPEDCRFGEGCKFEHNLRTYLTRWKKADLQTFGGKCPVWELKGKCDLGWKCRFVGSHMNERDTEDGRKELVLLENRGPNSGKLAPDETSSDTGVVNVVSTQSKIDLTRRKILTPKSDEYLEWLEKAGQERNKASNKILSSKFSGDMEGYREEADDEVEDNRAQYTEPPLLPSEKRRIYFGPETPILAPLTTQGNLPFRRMCVDFGAQLTYSEMAMSLPLLQGQKSEWALMRAHESEVKPPRFVPASIVAEYQNFKDLKFGAQIAAAKPFQALKATEVLAQLCPHLRVIDFNCGCPIDLVFRQGAGSAMLDTQSKLDKMLRGMNAVSGEIPITVKIRMGTKDDRPTALKLIDRLTYGDHVERLPSGIAAITLHGRSRQQRYTKNANWAYIADCAAAINRYNEQGNNVADTVRQTDDRYGPAANRVYFVGNGDCYSHIDYQDHLEKAGVDSVMVARGALIKPWIFEEIEKGQYLDKSATERLAMVEKYARYGLETWGSDEMGLGTTRRFLLEWLSFAYRYVPVGIMEHLPPNLQDRPPAWRGRNELETLLGSDNYLDWIKIRYAIVPHVHKPNVGADMVPSEMFLGPAHKDFRFEPKHKSNSYEIEAEG